MILKTSRASVQGVSTIEKKFSARSGVLELKTLLVGVDHASEFITEDNQNKLPINVIKVLTEREASIKFGKGSDLHNMCKAYFLGNDESLPAYVLPLNPLGRNKRVVEFKLTHHPNKSGVLTFYTGLFGKAPIKISFKEDTGTAETIPEAVQRIVDEISKHDDLPFTATIDSTDDTKFLITFNQGGSFNNSYTIDFNLHAEDNKALPDGMVLAKESDTLSTDETDISQAITLLKNTTEWFTDIVLPITIEADIMQEVLTIAGNPNEKSGNYDDVDYKPFTVHAVSKKELDDISNYRSASLIIYKAENFYENEVEISSYIAGKLTLLATDNLSQSYNKTPLRSLNSELNYNPQQDTSYISRDELYKTGITPLYLYNDEIVIGDVISTWLPENNIDAPLRLLVNQRKVSAMAYDIKTVDNSKENINRPIVKSVGATTLDSRAIDTDTVKANIVMLIGDWENRALIYDGAFSVERLQVSIDDFNSDRINKVIPVLLSGNNRIGQTEVQVSREVQLSITN